MSNYNTIEQSALHAGAPEGNVLVVKQDVFSQPNVFRQPSDEDIEFEQEFDAKSRAGIGMQPPPAPAAGPAR